MPYIEIWRDNSFTSDENDLMRVHLTDESTTKDLDVSVFDNNQCGIATYQYILKEPFDAQAGDIVGIAVRDGLEGVRMCFENHLNAHSYRDTRVELDGSSNFFNPDATRVVNETRYIPLLTVLLGDCYYK